MQSAESMHATAPHIRKTLFVKVKAFPVLVSPAEATTVPTHPPTHHTHTHTHTQAFRRINNFRSSADSVQLHPFILETRAHTRTHCTQSRFHIFLSYRRSHKHWSRCVKQRLEKPAPGKDGAKRMVRVRVKTEC